jgi:hypothetical protein
MSEDYYVWVTPGMLRQAADDLEADPENLVTWITTNGDYVNLVGEEPR